MSGMWHVAWGRDVACLLSAVCCLLHIVCSLLSAVYYLLPTAYCLLSAAYCLLPAANCLLSAVLCLLSACLYYLYCLLSTAYCLLSAAYCLLSALCCLPHSHCWSSPKCTHFRCTALRGPTGSVGDERGVGERRGKRVSCRRTRLCNVIGAITSAGNMSTDLTRSERALSSFCMSQTQEVRWETMDERVRTCSMRGMHRT
jgi:hypothetical protein